MPVLLWVSAVFFHSLNVNDNGMDFGRSGLTYDKKADSGIKFLRQTDPGSDLIKKFS